MKELERRTKYSPRGSADTDRWDWSKNCGREERNWIWDREGFMLDNDTLILFFSNYFETKIP